MQLRLLGCTLASVFTSVFTSVLALGLALGGYAAPAGAALLVPNGTTPPFEGWTRGSVGTSYAHWDLFTSANGPNSPDVGNFQAASATVTESTNGASGAFLTSLQNIYSFAGPAEFTAIMPGLNLGPSYDTRFVAQIRFRGTELDLSSVLLSYGATQLVAADETIELDRGADGGGFGGDVVTRLFAWDVIGINPSQFTLVFAAQESSMSLDQVVIDTYAYRPLAGDFDRDGAISATDYDRWREQFGTPGPHADGNHDGWVDAADYTIWRDSRGAGLAAGSAASVPEPSANLLMGCVGVALLFGWFCDRYLASTSV